MGTDAVVQAAEQYGKGFICSEKIAAVDLQDTCNKVRTFGTIKKWTDSYFYLLL